MELKVLDDVKDLANGELAETADSEPVPSQDWNHRCGWRHIVVWLVFVVVVVCYADRTNIGIVLARHDLPGISHRHKGTILSSFFVGYFPSQIVGGILSRRWGGKPTLLFAALTWSAFDLATPVLARAGLVPLLFARIGMGLGEGLVCPTQHSLANFWIPVHERAFLLGVMTSGQEFGSVLANLISPQVLKSGVVCVFATWAIAAALWAVAFGAWAASAPEVHRQCVLSGEAAWIRNHRDVSHFEEVRATRAHESPFPRRLISRPVSGQSSQHIVVATFCGTSYFHGCLHSGHLCMELTWLRALTSLQYRTWPAMWGFLLLVV